MVNAYLIGTIQSKPLHCNTLRYGLDRMREWRRDGVHKSGGGTKPGVIHMNSFWSHMESFTKTIAGVFWIETLILTIPEVFLTNNFWDRP